MQLQEAVERGLLYISNISLNGNLLHSYSTISQQKIDIGSVINFNSDLLSFTCTHLCVSGCEIETYQFQLMYRCM